MKGNGEVRLDLSWEVKSIMPTFILNDVSSDIWVDTLDIDAPALGLGEGHHWSIKKQRLRGGRREGIDLITVDNGALRFSVVPTRGMGLWRGWYDGNRLGWDSPVTDGPINPALVNLSAAGGLGWLDGFDELLARCGLENNGAPFEVKTRKPDGSESHATFGLHGKIANIPASYSAVHVAADAPHEIVVEGHVEEARLFGPQIRMETRITTVPGSNALVVRDEFVNLKEQPVEIQILYHWNFGPPFLDPGARFLAPIQSVTPRDNRAQQGVAGHDEFGAPQSGFAEQVYFYQLHAVPKPNGHTLAMLCNQKRDKGVVLRFCNDELPAFTLWKNTGGLRDGYVAGLEPGTNYPNARPFERTRNRVVTLGIDGRYTATTTLEVLVTADAIAAVQKEIEALQAQRAATINTKPIEPFAPEQ
jgi:hypothetical protein